MSRAPDDPVITALHKARKDQGLTLLDVARRMGLHTAQSVWHWENGTRSPSLVNLRKWADALRCDVTAAPAAALIGAAR